MMMDEHVVEYVSGLPAVKSVTNDRIRYTDEFGLATVCWTGS